MFQKSVINSIREDERNFKNDWKALFENDKKEVLEIQNQINQTDKEINQMVYKVYDLTEDEIKIVEGVWWVNLLKFL